MRIIFNCNTTYFVGLNLKMTNKERNLIKNENGTIREIAKKYGIGKTQVGYIKQGKRQITFKKIKPFKWLR